MEPLAETFTDVSVQVRDFAGLRRFAEAHDCEVETYGETSRISVSFDPKERKLRTKETFNPRRDYATVRNVPVSLIAELRKSVRVLRGYPMKPREFHRQAELRKPLSEKPVCPIHGTDKDVHWIGRDHWTCTANHWPQHFGMLRLT